MKPVTCDETLMGILIGTAAAFTDKDLLLAFWHIWAGKPVNARLLQHKPAKDSLSAWPFSNVAEVASHGGADE